VSKSPGKGGDRLAGLTLRVIGQMDLSPCNGCDHCGLRCEAGVQMTREEYEAVRRYVEDSPDKETIRRVTKQDKAVDLGDGVSVTMCRYRDMEKGGCAVYPARPLICKLLGHVEWMPCPIEKVPRMVPTDEAVALMREYAKAPRHTFEEWDAELSADYADAL
jgi:Fe-S-cluster containining protein